MVVASQILLIVLLPWAAMAETSQQPYIDRVREELRAKDAKDGVVPEGSYSEKIRQELDAKDRADQRPAPGSYIDELKEKDPTLMQPVPGDGYTQEQKAKIEPKPDGGAIQAVQDGTSELELKRPGKITGAFGLHVGALTIARNFTSGGTVSGRAFSDTYASGYDPNLTLHYEFQPFHSEIFGNFGLFTELGILMNTGFGKFDGYPDVKLNLPDGSGTFPETSQTFFQFFALPIVVGLNYRFNLTYILRPYVGGGVGFVGMIETRTDAAKPNKAWTTLLQGSAGVSFLLDFLSKSSAWNLYAEHGIKRAYLFAEYRMWLPFAGDVSLSTSGIYAGFLGEF